MYFSDVQVASFEYTVIYNVRRQLVTVSRAEFLFISSNIRFDIIFQFVNDTFRSSDTH